MTIDEAVDFWFRRVDFERKTPTSGDLKLEHIRTLLERLGDPQRRLRIIHLAGSKGKGSTSAMLAAILRAQGDRVGLFTSPHLANVEERIQVDGEPISADDLTARIEEVRAVGHAPAPGDDVPLNESLTFFEIATALGFLHFAHRRVDWAVVEVGLGGRFDSTNICMPELAIITSISLDHTQTLGDTLAKIAFEKAGIVKAGRPTISGVTAPEARDVIEERCRVVGSPLKQLDRDFSYEYAPARIGDVDQTGRVAITTWRRSATPFDLNLVGSHQAANAALAVAAIDLLRDREAPITERAIARGLAGVIWPGRLEIVGRRPLVLLDCAHNVASAAALRSALIESFPVAGRRILVFAGSRDKDIAGMLAILTPIFDRVVLTRFENSPRALPVDQLAEMMPPRPDTLCADHPRDAIRMAMSLASENDLVCITGSVFLVGQVRALLKS